MSTSENTHNFQMLIDKGSKKNLNSFLPIKFYILLFCYEAYGPVIWHEPDRSRLSNGQIGLCIRNYSHRLEKACQLKREEWPNIKDKVLLVNIFIWF